MSPLAAGRVALLSLGLCACVAGLVLGLARQFALGMSCYALWALCMAGNDYLRTVEQRGHD